MRPHALALSCVVQVLCSALVAQGQRPARIEGRITDSVHARPLAGAMVMLTRRSPEPVMHRSVVTDERGRYRIDSLVPGRYSVLYTHPLVDSLALILPAAELTLAEGEQRQLDFALPSQRAILGAVCAGLSSSANVGAIVGEVTDADASDAAVRDGIVVIGWEELSVDRQTLATHAEPHAQGVRINTDGGFRFCGLPTGTWISMQVQRNGRAGSLVPVMVPEDAALLVTHISYSASSSRPLDTDPADTASAFVRGTATLRGRVTTMDGVPLGDALLRVPDAGIGARTDSAGRFVLERLPAGSQTLEARRIGYRYEQLRVDLHPGVISEVTLALDRAVSLDSIRVVARRSLYREFENRARQGAFGTFLREEDIERLGGNSVASIIRAIPGWRVEGGGYSSTILPPGRGITSLWRAGFGGDAGASAPGCRVNVVIDGVQNMDIDLVKPGEIAAIELYRDGIGAPLSYRSACGLVVIWTKQ
jgi:hypothetical protein